MYCGGLGCASPRESKDRRPHVFRFRPGPLHREGQHTSEPFACPRASSLIAGCSASLRTSRRLSATRTARRQQRREQTPLRLFLRCKPGTTANSEFERPRTAFRLRTVAACHYLPFLLLFSLSFLSSLCPCCSAAVSAIVRCLSSTCRNCFIPRGSLYSGPKCLCFPSPPVNLYRSAANNLTDDSRSPPCLNAQLNNSENLQIAKRFPRNP